MSLIRFDNLTKDYGLGRGVFGLKLEIERGQVFGFVGTNGAGKTTAIRQLMGFIKPDGGNASINGLDCWQKSAEIKRMVGYVPGEIAFPDEATGSSFLKRQAELLGLKNMSFAQSIIGKLQLDPTANLKRMSKGMKQKTAIAAAFMADSEILILDEPTTGLDPLMRAEFIDLLNDEKKKGKTIFMSSHMFEEVEDTCDMVAFIKDGKLIATVSTDEIRHNKNKTYKLEFLTQNDYERFKNENINIAEKSDDKRQAEVHIDDSDINAFTSLLKNYQLKYITEIKYSLEKYFKNLY